ncbi:MAG: hypothetical protein GX410_01395, partial [Elusimicrobia bacterium]|nr:hypothetical protein [Elusimicrobiota bacterium]
MKCRKYFVLVALLALAARGAVSFAGAQSRTDRQAKVLQEIGLQTSAQAIKSLEDRKAEEEQLYPAQEQERQRLETQRQEEQERAGIEEQKKAADAERLRMENEQAALREQEQKGLAPRQAQPATPAAQAKPPEQAASVPQAPVAPPVVVSLPPIAKSAPEAAPEPKDLSSYPVVPVYDDNDEESPKLHGASERLVYGKLLSDGPKN